MAQIPTPWGEVYPPPASMSLTLPVPFFLVCFLLFCRSLVVFAYFTELGPLPKYALTNYVPRFLFFFFFVPSVPIDDMRATSGGFFLWIFLFFSMFPNGFLLCDHGLDL